MRASVRTLVAVAALGLGACATLHGPPAGDRIPTVNPASVAAAPAQWDGREVEMVGLLVWESENLGLYQSYGAYCRRSDRAAIYVDWHGWPGVSQADNRRLVAVRGVFRNRQGVAQPGGGVLVSNAAPGPGPLEPGTVVRWLSAPAKPCPAVRP